MGLQEPIALNRPESAQAVFCTSVGDKLTLAGATAAASGFHKRAFGPFLS